MPGPLTTSWPAAIKGITGDSLWKMEAYRLALFAADLGWHDVTKLAGDRRKLDLAGQLYRALGSIEANIPEGYSRGSGRDRARFYGLRDRDQVEAPRVVGRGGISEARGARRVKHPVGHYWGSRCSVPALRRRWCLPRHCSCCRRGRRASIASCRWSRWCRRPAGGSHSQP